LENIKLNQLVFNSDGLIPTIAQERSTNEILMVAYSNQESLTLSLKNNKAYFWSRSKKKIWLKGETSGNILKLFNIYSDCDNDTLIFEVDLDGSGACHTGAKTCFFKKLKL
jgi:phosphoribosyl-AMP cyclohydrolase|tara:strand:- start:150 stop:482 length:333 start_codon:yes stop_codon:yes gene_type:complete